MKKKRIILAVLAFALVAGIAAGWYFWKNNREEPNSDHLDWVWIPQTYKLGALSEEGYYYGSYLSYCDFSTGEHVVLCSKVGCGHEDYDCDAYTGTRNGQEIYFEDGYLYYVGSDSSGRHVFRRDATGAALVTVGTPGEYYTKQKKSVDIDAFTLADGYLFYSGRVGTDLGDTVTLDTEFIARMNLVTGKEEILVEVQMENPGDHLWLCAVRGNGAIYTRYITPDMDRDDPDYSDALLQSSNKLYMWSEETGESVVLLEKPIREFSQVSAVYGGKVFYKTLSMGSVVNSDLYAYDLTTGKDQKWISGYLKHLGGGYALYAKDENAACVLINLLTREELPNVLNQIADGGTGNMRCVSQYGVLLNWYGNEHRKENEDDEYGYRDDHTDYISYASLADGLQQEDLISVFNDEIYINDPNISQPTTDPDETTPTEPENSVMPIIFAPLDQCPNDQVTIDIEYLPETVENPENLPVLKWVIMLDSGGRSTTFREDAVHDLNQMLSNLNMPYRVQLAIMCYESDMDGDYFDWFSNPEVMEVLRDADLIFANMSQDQQKRYLMPITDYITGDAQPSLQNAVPHQSNWNKNMTDGEIYSIPSNVYRPTSVGFVVDEEFMRQNGLTAEDFNVELWEMDELLDRLTKLNGGKGVFDAYDDMGMSLTRSMTRFSVEYIPARYQQIGALFAIDLAAETPKVVNLLEEEPIQKTRMAFMRYRASGYIFEYDPQNPQLEAKVLLTTVPGNTAFAAYGSVYIPSGFTRDVSPFENADVMGIAATSQNQEQSLSLLHLIAENEAFRNQLCYGTEGQNYTVTDGAVSTIVDTKIWEEVTVVNHPDGTTTTITKGYGSYVLYSMSRLSPLSGFGKLDDPNKRVYCYEGKTKLETYREMVESAGYLNYPIVFDFSGLTEELEQMGYALGKYLQNGNFSGLKSMSEVEYAKLLQEVKTDGGDRIVAELQRQLDAWIAEHPDWQ